VKGNLMTKKVLVTGGKGFIGSSVVKLLVEKRYRVTVLDNLSTGYRDNIKDVTNVEFIEGDIRDKDLVDRLVRDIDGIFHLAADVGNLKSIRRKTSY
jgi:UDP-glucose 4-epimerase